MVLPEQDDLPAIGERVTCPGPSVFDATVADIGAYLPLYAKLLPAIFIPNFSYAAYAVCAKLSLRYSRRMRVLGVAHGEGAQYIEWLTYYESIIHRFIAVSEEIARRLRQALVHRQDDIVTRTCPVEVPPRLQRRLVDPGAAIRITYAGRITNYEKKVMHLLERGARVSCPGHAF